MMRRRRFLTICAAAAAGPAFGTAPLRWHGQALGAEATLELHGPPDQTRAALAAALVELRKVEHLFSLYDPSSALSQLNATGHLSDPAPDMLHLFDAADGAYRLTGGRFDPTVQAIWPNGGDLSDVGWPRVAFGPKAITLGPRQALTFNGIAQGYATDLATEALERAGLTNVLVNVGEHRALGPSRRLGIADPEHGIVGTVTAQNAAIATSSPAATRTGHNGHILSPLGEPARWSTVTVMADRATQADGLSTGLCHAPLSVAQNVRKVSGVHAIVLVAFGGDVLRL